MTSLVFDQARLRRALLGFGLVLLCGGAVWVGIAAGLVESSPTTPPKVYIVTTVQDTAGACTPLDGIGYACPSLRAAIDEANGHPNMDRIEFDLPLPSTITLTGPLEITEGVIIDGPTEGTLTLDGQNSTRHFTIRRPCYYGGSLSVRISNLTLINGHQERQPYGACYAPGGSILFSQGEDCSSA